ncbi:succinyl-diaminopimelate desuccinylase [Terrihabitans soli]|uniref:Succinyl-diaminopimelate desuccinylase n=1 Tax=Terrihabitans soli TaxID=708113 RepID=A0A6S6QL06_9HYPH|nr:succinyl-diaminopimelate desuccinylase [Terrihabitans soli]
MTDPRNPVELAQALIRCKSVTPEEGGALTFLRDVLKETGFDTHLRTFSDSGTPDVTNLYARIGESSPVLLLAGHTDVVPPGDEAAWSADPFGGDIRDGVLYGRGAVDMKGGLAAMIAATMRYLAGGGGTSNGSIAFLITGDEEGPAVNGTPKLLNFARDRGQSFDHCLLAEPSSRGNVGDEIKIGRRGSLSGLITVHGKQGHVAYPKQAENPIRKLLAILDALSKPLDFGTVHFERSNLEVTSVDVGNETVNIIPAKATARFNVRFNDAHTLDGLKQIITERVDRAASETRHDLVFLPGASSSFVAPPGSFVELVAMAVAEETGTRPALSTGGGTSDARFIKDFCPVVELGLVNATMHQVDERVPTDDLDRLTSIYERVISNYFADAQRKIDEEAAKAPLFGAPKPVYEEKPLPVPAPAEEPVEEIAAISRESDLEAALEAALNAEADAKEEEAEAEEAALNGEDKPQ